MANGLLLREKALGCLLGVYIGDALGAPWECRTRDEILALAGGRVEKYFPASATHKFLPNWPAGKGTDDTDFTDAIVRAYIITKGQFNMDEIARQHVLAFERSSAGCGKGSKAAIERLKAGVHWSEAAVKADGMGAGNGVAMKITPLGIVGSASLAAKDFINCANNLENARALAQMTHATRIGTVSGIMHASVIAYCLYRQISDFRAGCAAQIAWVGFLHDLSAAELANVSSAGKAVATLFALVAIVLTLYRKNMLALSSIFWFGSTLVQPVVSIIFFVFFLLSTYKNVTKSVLKYITLATLGIMIPMGIVFIVFRPTIPLDAKTFVNLYAYENLPSHYIPSEFGSIVSFVPWYLTTGIIMISFLFFILYFEKRHKRNLSVLSFLFGLSYIGSILTQYFLVEKIPIKMVAVFGPSRYTTVGYWMLSILTILLLSENNIFFRFIAKKLPLIKLNLNRLVLFVVFLFFVLLAVKDNPFLTHKNLQSDFYNWLESTNQESVLAAYFGQLTQDIPLVGHRAIFSGNGLPFSENYFREYTIRKNLLYGSDQDNKLTSGSWIGEKHANFYRELKPIDFYKISENYRLDYVVIEKKYSENFAFYKPIFVNDTLLVYKVSDFK